MFQILSLILLVQRLHKTYHVITFANCNATFDICLPFNKITVHNIYNKSAIQVHHHTRWRNISLVFLRMMYTWCGDSLCFSFSFSLNLWHYFV